jgi:hypothetical protein
MNKQKWIIISLALLLMAATGGLLTRLRANQRLGLPGVKTSVLPGSNRLQVDLPERVLDYESETVPVDKMVLDYLPADTSFGQRMYKAADGFYVNVNVVLMGSDRTSLHKPEFCLGGAGWTIDQGASSETSVHIEQPIAYDLPVMKLLSSKEVNSQGRKTTVRGVYVYWFVNDREYTARHSERMWSMAKGMLRTGVLQRWAYISYFAACAPGQEDVTFERITKMIAASVPEFQLTPAPQPASVTAR